MTKLWSIAGNTQKLDGGAMFGNAPKAMWEHWAQVDGENRIELACRALLATPLNGKTVLLCDRLLDPEIDNAPTVILPDVYNVNVVVELAEGP